MVNHVFWDYLMALKRAVFYSFFSLASTQACPVFAGWQSDPGTRKERVWDISTPHAVAGARFQLHCHLRRRTGARRRRIDVDCWTAAQQYSTASLQPPGVLGCPAPSPGVLGCSTFRAALPRPVFGAFAQSLPPQPTTRFRLLLLPWWTIRICFPMDK